MLKTISLCLLCSGCALFHEPDNFVPPVPYELLQPCESATGWYSTNDEPFTMGDLAKNAVDNWRKLDICQTKVNAWQTWYSSWQKKGIR